MKGNKKYDDDDGWGGKMNFFLEKKGIRIVTFGRLNYYGDVHLFAYEST